jgi:hypothetical protein
VYRAPAVPACLVTSPREAEAAIRAPGWRRRARLGQQGLLRAASPASHAAPQGWGAGPRAPARGARAARDRRLHHLVHFMHAGMWQRGLSQTCWAAAMCMAVGKVSLELWPMFTWLLGCTGPLTWPVKIWLALRGIGRLINQLINHNHTITSSKSSPRAVRAQARQNMEQVPGTIRLTSAPKWPMAEWPDGCRRG